jgi:uncharacterized protein (DUF1697 family)
VTPKTSAAGRGTSALIGLLRGVNVGGSRLISMADLRNWMTGLGHGDVQTLLQSGNVVFRPAKAGATARIEEALERSAQKALALETEFFVRTADEWDALIAGNPFAREARDDPGHLILMCLKAAPTRTQLDALRATMTGPEKMQCDGAHLYITYPTGMGTTRLTSNRIERALDTRGTVRSGNTVVKLRALVRARE